MVKTDHQADWKNGPGEGVAGLPWTLRVA